MSEPSWLREARRCLGVREIPGPKHSAVIMGWIAAMGAKVLGIAVKDDETAWCGTFVAHCMTSCGLTPPPIAVRASSWATWGRSLLGPRPGCVLVFTREGGGHVGFYVGEDADCYHVLGGNQGNAVSITRIAKDRLSAMCWPFGPALPPIERVLLTLGGAPVSRNEA